MTIKAVEWVRKVRDANHEKTKNMSFEERKAYIQAQAAAAKKQAESFRK